jgi:hypothetical protein
MQGNIPRINPEPRFGGVFLGPLRRAFLRLFGLVFTLKTLWFFGLGFVPVLCAGVALSDRLHAVYHIFSRLSSLFRPVLCAGVVPNVTRVNAMLRKKG